MGVIDEAQNVVVEVIGTVIFAFGSYGVAGPEVGLTSSTSFLTSVIVAVIGLIIMGYKAIPKRIVKIVSSLRSS